MIIDAKNTTFTFNGQPVGGLISYQFFQGVAREVLHRPLAASGIALPSYPDYGRCQLTLARDQDDLGQAEMADSYANRTVVECVITWANGNVQRFQGFCLILPTTGSKAPATGTTLGGVAVIRISGVVTTDPVSS